MTREELLQLQAMIERLREHTDDCLIIGIGTCGADVDVEDGFAIATVQMGNDEASARAKYLDDAIRLARRKIIDLREARKRKAKKSTGETGA